jgi:hypothetical protein
MATNNAQIEKALKEAAKLGKSAGVRAVNDAAYKTREHMQKAMSSVFDRPTPFVTKSIVYKKANINDVNPRSKVFIADEPIGKGNNPTNTLMPEISGGYRKYKRFEKALRYKNILPPKMYAVPGADAKLDQYGNISGPWIVRILSALQGFTEVGYLANETVRSRLSKKNPLELFVIKESQGKNWELGIYQRAGKKIKQLIRFVKTPKYQERFKFYTMAEKFFNENVMKQLNYQLSKSGGAAGPPSEVF